MLHTQPYGEAETLKGFVSVSSGCYTTHITAEMGRVKCCRATLRMGPCWTLSNERQEISPYTKIMRHRHKQAWPAAQMFNLLSVTSPRYIVCQGLLQNSLHS